MADYCVYCGSKLIDGKCSCPMSIAFEVEQTEAAKLQEELEKKRIAEEAAAQAERDKIAALEKAEADRRAEEEWEAAKIAEREAAATKAKVEEAAARQQFEGKTAAQTEDNTAGNQFGANDKETPDDIKNVFTNTMRIIPEFIKRPYSLLEEALRGKYRNEGFIIGGATLLLIFLTCTLHLPVAGISAFIGIGYRALIGLIAALIFAVLTAVTALGIYIFRDKSNERITYVNAAAAFSLLLLPVAITTVLIFLFGFFIPTVAMLIMGVGTLLYDMLSLILIYENIQGNSDIKIWKTLVVYILVTAAVSIVVGISISTLADVMTNQAVNSFYGGMGGYGGLWS